MYGFLGSVCGSIFIQIWSIGEVLVVYVYVVYIIVLFFMVVDCIFRVFVLVVFVVWKCFYVFLRVLIQQCIFVCIIMSVVDYLVKEVFM